MKISFTQKKIIFILLVEPYNFECSQCGDVYSTGKKKRKFSNS